MGFRGSRVQIPPSRLCKMKYNKHIGRYAAVATGLPFFRSQQGVNSEHDFGGSIRTLLTRNKQADGSFAASATAVRVLRELADFPARLVSASVVVPEGDMVLKTGSHLGSLRPC